MLRLLCANVILALLLLPAVYADEPSVPIDPVTALLVTLDLSDDATNVLHQHLSTLDGRIALEETLEAVEKRVRSERLRAALDQLLEELTAEDGALNRQMLRVVIDDIEPDLDELAPTVLALRKNVVVDHAIAADLAAFVKREDAARILYEQLVRRRCRPGWPAGGMGRWLAPGDDGRLVVPAVLRWSADAALARDREIRAELARLKLALPAVVEDLPDDEKEWLADALHDDLGIAIALRLSQGAPSEASDRLLELLGGDAQASDEREKLLAAIGLYAVEWRGYIEDVLRTARWYASRLDSDEALDPWREMLHSPRAMFLGPRRAPTASKPTEVLRDHTAFGRALVIGEDQSVRVNKHTSWELDQLLEKLLAAEAETAPLRDAIRAYAEGVEDAEWAELLRSEAAAVFLVDAARREAGDAVIDAWAEWQARWLDSSGAKAIVHAETLGAEFEAYLDEVPVIEAELGADDAQMVVDLDALDYQTEHIDLLRSSIFYNPRTAVGRWTYFTAFDDHFAARLFGTFGWNAKVSKDLDDFKTRIRARKKELEQLARTHDKLIVHMSGVPPWLSSWEGKGTFEGGGWEDKQAHPPKDVEVWKEMVTELALVMRDLKGVERYYEFWNEPDLKYWQGSLEDFLKLYEATVRAVKAVDPEGKVGGCAPNQWDGRIRKRTGSDILNYELIRYAKKNDVPLDFISWHHFGRPVPHIDEAKQAYLAEWKKVGFEGEPEWLITEWSNGGRGTPYGAVSIGELMLGFFQAGVTAQCASCWEEFHRKPDPKHFPPWGLMTQQGERKNMWYVHRFLDRLARDSRGVAIQRPDDKRTIVVSKKADDVYDLLVWRKGTPARLLAAWKVLQDAGFTKEDARAYRTTRRLERAIAAATPLRGQWVEAFAKAKQAWDAHPVQTERLVLAFDGVACVEVLLAESVWMEHRMKRAAVKGNEVACALEPYEVLRLRVRVYLR